VAAERVFDPASQLCSVHSSSLHSRSAGPRIEELALILVG
jgi:hypothetical protein